MPSILLLGAFFVWSLFNTSGFQSDFLLDQPSDFSFCPTDFTLSCKAKGRLTLVFMLSEISISFLQHLHSFPEDDRAREELELLLFLPKVPQALTMATKVSFLRSFHTISVFETYYSKFYIYCSPHLHRF